MNDLYYSYTNFEKAIDRAVINMPIAIDYEIIFTSKEIQNGIPALQEFLEQRALYEQEQIERAKESEVEHETYNFEGLDVDGRLIMERAMNETTHYLGNKARLQKDIALAQSEKDSIKKDFDEKSKDYQRNLRDIREEIASLKSKIEVVTNEITRSSLRRQQQAEIEKEQNIEKEIEKETKKYNDKVSKIDSQIQAKEDEIAQAKDIAEKALIDEFEHFSKKVYKELKTDAQKDVQDHVQALENDKNELAILLEEKDKLMAEKLALYEDKANNFDAVQADVEESKVINAELKNQISTLNDEIEAKNQEIFEIKQELESRKREIVKKDEMIDNFKKKKGEVEVYRYFDANGNEFYFDENENPYYLGEDGSPIYYDNENQVSQEYVENIEREEDLTLNENTLMDTSEEGAEDPALNDNIESETSEEGVEAFEENLTEENLVSEEVASEEAPVPAEKPKSTRSRKTKAESEKSESGTKSKKSQSAKQSGTKKKNITKKASEKATDKENDKSDIEQTLNKLAKAAEEKMKTAKAEKTENSSTKKKKKNN